MGLLPKELLSQITTTLGRTDAACDDLKDIKEYLSRIADATEAMAYNAGTTPGEETPRELSRIRSVKRAGGR